jgi:hypothetical protein
MQDSVEQVLSLPAVLSYLRGLVIEFCFERSHYHDLIVLTGSLRRFTQAETDYEAFEIENKDGSRSLMKQPYIELSRNTMMTVKHLELKNLTSRHCSAWGLAVFQSSLHGLSSFTISLGEEECSTTEKHINLTPAHGPFISLLDEYFFQHLAELAQLRFAATKDRIVELRGDRGHAPLPLRR